MRENVKIYGLCRFSYFGRSDTGKSIATLEDAHEKLWNPERMAVRFHLFENITLPSIRNQTDQNFQFVIVASNEMPDKYHARLNSAVEGMDNIRIERTSANNINAALKHVMIEASNDRKDTSVHFRLDDDDAVSDGYIERLREVSAGQPHHTMITFPKGVLGFTDRGMGRHREFQKNAIAIGLALIKPPGATRTPLAIQHRAYAKDNPVFTDPTFTAYHYTRHTTNNTNGYEKRIHRDGGVVDTVARNSRKIHPEFSNGARSTPEADKMIAEAFRYTSGDQLRDIITQTLDVETLLEQSKF